MRGVRESFAGRTGRRRAGLRLLVFLLLGLAGAVAVPAALFAAQGLKPPASVYEGRELAEVLRELQSRGLAVVFTSELVRPGMTVRAEPAVEEPRAVLEEVLAPHGLTVREGPGGVLVVVVAASTETSEDGPAEEETVFERPYLHDEIVVQPSRLWLLGERPDASFSWSRDEIERLPHLGGDVLRATSLLPGTAANDVTAQFSVHGGRRDEVRILLDGQELYDAFHLEDYDNALSIVPATVLGSASLTTGAFPASQGDRMSGVLDLRTVEPPSGRRYTLGLSVLDLLASGSRRFAEDRGAWLVTARRGSLDLAGRAIGDEDPAFWDVLGKAELATAFGLVTAHALVAVDELELDRVEEEDFSERLENDYRRSYGWLTHQATPGDRLLVETAASWAGFRRDRSSETIEEEGSFVLRDRRNLEVLGLTQTWTFQVEPRHLTRWGFEARSYDASFDYTREQDPEFVVVAPFAPPRETSHRFDDALRGEHYGVWASDRFTVRERLTAELGLRYDHHTATGDRLLSPRVNLAWRLGERSVLRAAWGRFFQSQRPYELEVEDGETALHEAELSEHWVLGYEALLRENAVGLDAVRAELFRREIDDPRPRYENLLEPLNFFPEIEPDRVRVAPEGSRTQGVELLVRGSRGERFDWWLAYSWAQAEDRFTKGLPGTSETVPRALDQPHTVSLDLNFRLPGRWNLNLAWRYHSGWPTTPVEGRFVADPEDPEDPEEDSELAAVFGPLRSERLPDYHRLDLRASRSWELRRGRWTLFFDVQNLYDRKNLAGFDLSLEEDEGTVELEQEHWPGLFPSLGIVWEL